VAGEEVAGGRVGEGRLVDVGKEVGGEGRGRGWRG